MMAGIYSSMHYMIPSQSWADWKDDWFWMFAYFSGGVWVCLFMATAPRLDDVEAQEAIKGNKVDKKNI